MCHDRGFYRMKDTMINGNLHVNLNPPHVSFNRGGQSRSLNNLTIDELKSLLVNLGLLDREQRWPLREFTFIVSGKFPSQIIVKAGLIPPALLPMGNEDNWETLLAS